MVPLDRALVSSHRLSMVTKSLAICSCLAAVCNAKLRPAFMFLETFLRATAVPAGTAEARISYGNSVCLSVCPSVTTRRYTKPR